MFHKVRMSCQLFLAVACVLCCCGLAVGEVGTQSDPGTRIVTVKVMADETFRKKKKWREEIYEHFARADEKFREIVAIGLKVVEVEPWETHQTKQMSALLRELRAGVKKGEADIVVGFTGHPPPQRQFITYQGVIRLKLPFIAGIALPLADYAVVRRYEGGRETRHTLLHEIAHLFGGLHVEEKSLLSTSGEDAFVIDDFNRRVFELTRDRDFSIDVRDLPRSQLDEIIEVYRSYGEGRDDEKPDHESRLRIAYLMLATADVDQAIEELRRLMEESPRESESLVRGVIIPELQNYVLEREPTTESYYMLGQAFALIEEWKFAGQYLIPNCQNQEHAPSCAQLGGVFFGVGDLVQAERALVLALELDDSSAYAHNILGSLYSLQGRTEDALDHFHRAVELDPENVGVHFNRGLAYQILGLEGPAEDSFREVLRLDEKNRRAQSKLALSLARQQKSNEARKQASRIEVGETEVTRTASFVLRDLALIYFILEDKKKSQRYLKMARQRGVDVTRVEEEMQAGGLKDQKMSAEALLREAEAYFWSERYPIARQRLERALEKNPNKEEIHYWLGRVAHEEEDNDSARKHYAQALKLNPKYAEASYQAGHLGAETGACTEALGHLQRYIEQTKKPSSRAWYWIGFCHFNLGDAGSAREALEKSAQLGSRGDTHYFLSQIYEQQGEMEASLIDLKLAAESRSLSIAYRPDAYLRLARALADRGEREEALRYARRAARTGAEGAAKLVSELER